MGAYVCPALIANCHLDPASSYENRNRIPWIIVSLCVFVSAVLLFALRTMLYLENRRRDRETRSTKYDEVYMKKELADGTVEKQLVDKVKVSSLMETLWLTI